MDQKLKINPWWSMWVKPKATIRAIIDTNSRYGFISLCFLYGLVQTIHLTQIASLGDRLPLWGIIALSLIFSIPVGFICFSFATLFIYFIGKILRGQGSYYEVRAAISWPNVTAIFTLISIGVLILTFQEIFFYRNFSEIIPQDWRVVLVVTFIFIEGILGIWKFIIFIMALSEVQKFSGWMAFLNVILTGVVFGVLFFLLSIVFSPDGGNNIGLLTR
ncbi:MAG: hypothetical protein WCG10_03355 [Chlamydiota bacterium]